MSSTNSIVAQQSQLKYYKKHNLNNLDKKLLIKLGGLFDNVLINYKTYVHNGTCINYNIFKRLLKFHIILNQWWVCNYRLLYYCYNTLNSLGVIEESKNSFL